MKRVVWQALLVISFVVLLGGLCGFAYSPDSGYVVLLGFVMLIAVAFRRYEKPQKPSIFSISVNSSIGVQLFTGTFLFSCCALV